MGLGASAGGLEALEQFFHRVPATSGLGFVVVQHLDPTHKGMLVELLQRATTMRVVQAKDRMKVEPNRVYVIPPNKDLALRQGALRLLVPAAPRGLRLPIDFFFRSLAADQHERCAGVILSGMGSDGTLGLAAIKEQGGAVFVQAPASAKFDAMPRSAIDAGLADIVAPIEVVADQVVAYCARARSGTHPEVALGGKAESALERVYSLLQSRTGHDFSQYKRSTVYRRIERRMGLHQITHIAGYVSHLQDSPQETTLLFKELLIGVTRFFRDSDVWDVLVARAIPALLAERQAGGVLRAWVPGCSSGEEAYSLAMVFHEALEQTRAARSVALQIFATDLDKDAIERARAGVYPANIAGDVSAERLRRFFVQEDGAFRVIPRIRETVVFATQNIIMDPPFTKLDILSCRNLLIYLEPALQKKLLPLFHYSLNPAGVLVLGSAESLGMAADRFAVLDAKARVFRRLEAAKGRGPVEFPASFRSRPSIGAEAPLAAPPGPPTANLQALCEQLLLERYAAPAVLTNDEGDILYVSGRTGAYLEPSAGKANWNIHAMAREGLRYELQTAFHKAVRERHGALKTRARVLHDGGERVVEITVEPQRETGALRGLVLVVFTESARLEAIAETPAVARPDKRLRPSTATQKLTMALREARQDAQSTREQMQTSQEELQSANEELQSANEELQSTNEELTTSKEEMQSMNEELQTLNHELQAKLDELTRANDDVRNLLDSTDIATLFLDANLKVRRFTAQTKQIIQLIAGDVGRPVTDLASALVYPSLANDALEVLQTLVFKENQVTTHDGRWFSVRIMPYRTIDNRIDGVVITFADITAAKTLEATLRQM